MSVLTSSERFLSEAIGGLNYTNPFSPERQVQEKKILGTLPSEAVKVWHKGDRNEEGSLAVSRIYRLCEDLSETLYSRIQTVDVRADSAELDLYDKLIVYWLFEKYRPAFHRAIVNNPDKVHFPFYRDYAADFDTYICRIRRETASPFRPEKTFAIYYQIHRAFYYIYDFIVGSSMEAASFRANIWQSIFTYDIYRYHRLLFDKMSNVSTLVTGESGTGKELVARAIALSQYIPFNGRASSFVQNTAASFKAIQLSAMPQSILESELFGYVKGAYTGASAEHSGYFETCTPHDTIFLDEIGEITPEVQIKLLRVLQTRSFQRIGEVKPMQFLGKVISATNRDLREACAKGTFRSDLFYRMCSDTIATVPLRKLIGGNRQELEMFVMLLSQRILGNAEEAGSFAQEVNGWILEHLGLEYPWPGNVREMEQCLRNLLIRGTYTPPAGPSSSPSHRLEVFRDSTMTAEQVMREYMQAVFDREGNLAKTARAAGVDRRTVRKYLNLDGAAEKK